MEGQIRPTTDELADMLGCSRGNTTRRWTAFTQAAEVVVPAIAELTKSRRPDRAARKTRAFARDVHLLATGSPDVLEALLRELAGRASGRAKE